MIAEGIIAADSSGETRPRWPANSFWVSSSSKASSSELKQSLSVAEATAAASGSTEPPSHRPAHRFRFDATDQRTYHALCVQPFHLNQFPHKTMEIRTCNLKAVRPGDPLFLFECGAGLQVDGTAAYRLVWKAEFVKNVPMPDINSFLEHVTHHRCSMDRLPPKYLSKLAKLVGWQLSNFSRVSSPLAFKRLRSQRSRFQFRFADLVICPVPSDGATPVKRRRVIRPSRLSSSMRIARPTYPCLP